MAHRLEFTPTGVWEDKSILDSVIRAYLVNRKLDVSDMLDFVLDPFREDRLVALADFAIAYGSDAWMYDIGKFGIYDCVDCGAQDIEYGSYADDCEEDEE